MQIAGQMSQRGLAMLFTAVASRVIGLGGLGLYRQVSQVLTIASQLGLAGFNYASMRFISRARANKDPGWSQGGRARRSHGSEHRMRPCLHRRSPSGGSARRALCRPEAGP